MTGAAISPWIWAVVTVVGVAGVLAWCWIATRRHEVHLRSVDGEARAARACTDEVRRQLESSTSRAERLARELAEAERGRAVAETRSEELRVSLDEQKRLLAAAESRLGDAFRSLA